jgi:hypothetical protein
MFEIDSDMTIHVTRGDVAFFSVSAYNGDVKHKFQPGDVVRIKVMQRKRAENVAFHKDFLLHEETDSVNIILTEEDTKIGDVISKPTDYWYEVELNPYTNPQTIIGYDVDGPKIFKLYPEGRDLGANLTQADIPVVDKELSLTSERPIANQAVARALVGYDERVAEAVERINQTADEAIQNAEDTASRCGQTMEETAESTRQAIEADTNDAIYKIGTYTEEAKQSLEATVNDAVASMESESEEIIQNAKTTLQAITDENVARSESAADRAESAADRAEVIADFEIDTEFSTESMNPIANRVVAEKVVDLEGRLSDAETTVDGLTNGSTPIGNADKLDGKDARDFADAEHKHSVSDIEDFPSSLPASDVPSWAKESEKPSYDWSEIENKPSTFTPASHNQAASTISAGTLGGKVRANASASATLTDAQVRDVVVLASDPGEGASVSYSVGTIVFTK